MGKRIIIIEDDNADFEFTPSLKAYSNPCEHCSNNPKNNPHASGFCNCILPYLNNPIY